MASSSSSNSQLNQGWTYDAFLSFSGEDTRNSFVAHLYRALDDRSIYTFRDDLGIHMGDSISQELIKSIQESRTAVVVFSENYAASSWCLDELVKIMDCWKLMGQTVIPVFYHIDPSNVRRQIGVFEKAFQKHEETYDLEKVQKWREALSEAANISGCDTANRNESECILKIVEEISSKCQQNSSAAKYLVGIVPRLQEFKSTLDLTSNGVQIIGIWGMGGSGKTTLAWAVYNEISNYFQGRSYVENVREVSKTSGLHFLQGQVLSELFPDPNMKVTGKLHGIELMATRLRNKKILLVLDDVDDCEQVVALAGNKNWFGMGSRIIITTRDQCCLKQLKVDKIYKSSMLDKAEAIQLFSLYAFESSSPPEDHEEDSNHVVSYAAGLPLALTVLGSFLYDRSMDEWKSTLERLEITPEEKINEILKISFDGLKEKEKKIFLDIACFFKGWDRSYITKVLDSFDLCAGIGISILIEKSLISVSQGRLFMHDRIQQMGWHIVRKVSDKPGEHSRMWLPNDVCHVLMSKTGTDTVEGIYLKLTGKENFSLSADSFKTMPELRFLHVNSKLVPKSKKFNLLPNKSKWILKGTHNYLCSEWNSKRSRHDVIPSKWSSKVTICLPSKLQWLTWKGYPFSESLPESFLGEKLVGLEMPNNDIIQLWKGRKNLDKLKFIDLSFSRKLTSTPDVAGAPNLELLILDECDDLVEIHPSVGDLKQLVSLSLSLCRNLMSLPSLLQMKSLETLILCGCSGLTKFPEVGENMGKLSHLELDETSIEELPGSIGNLTGLVVLSLGSCHRLKSLPDTISRLKCLKTLNLKYCLQLETLPKSLAQVQSLEELLLNESAVKELPPPILLIKNLKILRLNNCKGLMPSLFPRDSDSFKIGSEQPLFSSFGFLNSLSVSYCNLSEEDISGDLSSLSSLESLDLSGNPFKCLSHSLCQLPQLKILDVSRCSNLEALPALPSTISVLDASFCEGLKSFIDFTKYKSLWTISLHYYRFLKVGWEYSASLMLQSMLQGIKVANHRFSIVARAHNIPRWFCQQNEGNHMNLQLPLGWCHGNILGIAICALNSDYLRRIIIQFDLITEKMQQLNPIPQLLPQSHGSFEEMWLGFISIDFFKLLFPELKQGDWTQFQGCLCMHLLDDSVFSQTKKCVIRLVYKDDVEGAATMQSSALLDNSTGRPRLKYYDDDGRDYREVNCLHPAFTTACTKKKGPMGAEINFFV